jgi:hypothetical protein
MFIKSSNLLLIAFALVFFPRVLEALGFPSMINFIHFAILPPICAFVLTRHRDKASVSAVNKLLFGLALLMAACLSSALLNNAGAINVLLSFILLAEPFIFLAAIASISLSEKSFLQFRTWILGFAYCNLFFALCQKIVFNFDRFGRAGADNIKGVFIAQGSGHVVGASVSLTFAVYYFFNARNRPLWQRLAIIGAVFMHCLFADAKQVLFVFVVALALLAFTRLKNIGEVVQYIALLAFLVCLLYWASQTIFPALLTWARPELYGPNGDATQLKIATFRVVPTFFEYPANWFLGLGPGHSVGRLGGWMLKDYWSLLGPLGASKSVAGPTVWQVVGNSWLGDQSSMFSPLFSWAGIWGDLGLVGLGCYVYLCVLLWNKLCQDNLARFLMLTVFLFGLIFSQMEEPGYMLSVAVIAGMLWQEQQIRNRLLQRQKNILSLKDFKGYPEPQT